jgi:hypothetical protein
VDSPCESLRRVDPLLVSWLGPSWGSGSTRAHRHLLIAAMRVEPFGVKLETDVYNKRLTFIGMSGVVVDEDAYADGRRKGKRG